LPDTALAMQAQLRERLRPERLRLPFSPSAFHRYQLCPAAFRYDYVARLGGLPELTDPDDIDDAEPETEGGGAQMGTVFHAAAAAHARLPGAATADLLLGAVDACEISKLTPEQRATVRGWLERYLQSPLGREPPTPAMVERELNLTLEFEAAQLVLRGKADRLEPHRLVDFKTDAAGDGLVERYGDQLRLYALAARRAGWIESDAELAIYHAPTGAVLAETDEALLMGKLQAFAENLAQPSPALPPVRSELCRWCAARETVCERGRREWPA